MKLAVMSDLILSLLCSKDAIHRICMNYDRLDLLEELLDTGTPNDMEVTTEDFLVTLSISKPVHKHAPVAVNHTDLAKSDKSFVSDSGERSDSGQFESVFD